MQQNGVKPNQHCYCTIFNLCNNPTYSMLAKQLATHLLNSGLEMTTTLQTSLLNMYSQVGEIDSAIYVWHHLHKRHPDIVAWNVMIGAYGYHGYLDNSIGLFVQMQKEGKQPDFYTFNTLLNACAATTDLFAGKQVHTYLINTAREKEFLGALIYMYAKCGDLENATTLFERARNSPDFKKDVIAWNNMINVLGNFGQSDKALKLVEEMGKNGIMPDNVSMLALLNSFSHTGQADKAVELFYNMESIHRIKPRGEHVVAVVDALSRVGKVEEAKHFINSTLNQHNHIALKALLSGCRNLGDVTLAEQITQRLIELHPEDPSIYVLMSNIYAAAGRPHDRDHMRKLMEKMAKPKIPGKSWVLIDGKKETFLANDTQHPAIDAVLERFNELKKKLLHAGYKPDTSWVLRDIPETQKEDFLCKHR
jgi:pentatricopeptide repeat protein